MVLWRCNNGNQSNTLGNADDDYSPIGYIRTGAEQHAVHGLAGSIAGDRSSCEVICDTEEVGHVIAEFAPLVGVVIFGMIFSFGLLWFGDFLRVQLLNRIERW